MAIPKRKLHIVQLLTGFRFDPLLHDAQVKLVILIGLLPEANSASMLFRKSQTCGKGWPSFLLTKSQT